jgi:uncharacterized protein YjbJ (UPF0337 family)
MVGCPESGWDTAEPATLRRLRQVDDPGGLPAGRRGNVSHTDYEGMSAVGTVKNKTEAVKGTVKEAAGKATKNRSLEAKGKKDKAAGNVKQAGASIKKAL